MSLINDALRRASQTEKNRPQRPSTATGMEAVPVAPGSKVNLILAGVVVVALVLAGWFFKQWWSMRKNARVAPVPIVAAAAPQPAPAPVVVQKPAPVVQVAPARPVSAPAPVVVAPPPVVAEPAPAPAPEPVAPSVAVADTSAWPDLKISAIFYSLRNPRVLINGSIYGVGDQIEGVTLKEIHKDKIVLASGGRTKEILMTSQ